jgi:hypothetical protein
MQNLVRESARLWRYLATVQKYLEHFDSIQSDPVDWMFFGRVLAPPPSHAWLCRRLHRSWRPVASRLYTEDTGVLFDR